MSEPIAIVGSSCRLAGGCQSPSKLWYLLQKPYDISQGIPPDRFHPSVHNSSPRGYFLSDDVREFDASFFSINPLEAESMDPQHRLSLEVVYEALEEAGFPVEDLRGSDTAVYTGVMFHDYTSLCSQDHDMISRYHITGTAPNKASNRISHFFDWRGPSMTIDTACSSSLVALDQAVQQLRSGTSSLAVVTGSNLLLDDRPFIGFSNMGMLSPTGSCKMWDTAADGYARGEGVISVVLKPLRLALADGDNIQSVIRETGVNHNGRTTGITLPSATAQTNLIRDVYTRAGLDPSLPADRPQYIEAHGTGTQAGDPLEAEALATAFSLSRSSAKSNKPSVKPHVGSEISVGSIKTVFGHTEGAAGLAGILKASLALQHGLIPPNLGFQELNPKIDPHYSGLNVPTSVQKWPRIPANTARRASINSFGFGGTNAHVILESFVTPTTNGHLEAFESPKSSSILPYLFSASSEQSLLILLDNYRKYLQENNTIDPAQLSYTLACHRSVLPIRVFFPASSIDSLLQNIQQYLETGSSGYHSPLKTSKILGIFTGQGAQWPRMGVDLLAAYPSLAALLEELDESLQSLPQNDRPKWTLRKELERPSEESHIHTPEMCQPICTAVQLMLGCMLQEVYGISFSAVVGHSSGEIAAACFAGFFCPIDAIRIAFYRGLHVSQLVSSSDWEGRMLAASLSQDAAENLISATVFHGRVSVAAVNSPASVTISGDADAINEVKADLDSRSIFNRLLNVKTAYHSHHMSKCSSAYQASLKNCKIQVLRPSETSATWFSSVLQGKSISYEHGEALTASYWVDNLINPVMFRNAIDGAVSTQPDINFCLEVGPHPALKGPTMDTMKDVHQNLPPYSGTLARGKSDIVAVSECIGNLWAHLGGLKVPTFDSFKRQKTPLSALPSYPWDHRGSFWLPPASQSSSTKYKSPRSTGKHVDSLLGYQVDIGGSSPIFRWSNELKVDQLDWLTGHALEGQTILPATGYLVLALNASRQVAKHPIQNITLQDVKFLKAVRIDESSGASITTTMIILQNDEAAIHSNFYVEVHDAHSPENSTMAASMKVTIHLGTPIAGLLSEKESPPFNMTEIDPAKAYDSLARLGYDYTGLFQKIHSLSRCLGQAMATINWPSTVEREYVLHPALLDNAVQVLFSAFTDHQDGGLWNLHMPVSIELVTLGFPLSQAESDDRFDVESYLRQADPSGICGDVTIFDSTGQGIIQMEGLNTMPVTPPNEDTDLVLFSKTELGVAEPDGDLALGSRRASAETVTKVLDWERVALYYIRQVSRNFFDQDTGEKIRPVEIEPHHHAFLDFCSWLQETIRAGKHDYASSEWLLDTEETIQNIRCQYAEDDIDFRLIKMASDVLPGVIRHDTTMLQSFMADDSLSDWYQNSIVCSPAEEPLGEIISQISHRYRGLHVLEIGAGTGCATRSVLPALGPAFARYTFTDISSGFFDKAATQFSTYADRMDFKTFDLEQDPLDQGFPEGKYDVIVAYAVMHVASSLEDALRRVRRLLKPGGFLVLAEVMGDGPMALGLIFGGFTGWWAGREEGRRYSPTVSIDAWQTALANTGFSGVDTQTPCKDPVAWPISVIVSQAFDDQIQLLRRPLLSSKTMLEDLILVTDPMFSSPDVFHLLEKLLGPHSNKTKCYNSLAELDGVQLPANSTIVNMSHLNERGSESSERSWRGLQNLLGAASHFLWITDDYLSGCASSGLSVGLARSLVHEIPHLHLQMIDISRKASPSIAARVIAESVLRLTVNRDNDTLYIGEPEIAIDAKDQVLVPRLQPFDSANNRLNSSRRPVTTPLHIHDEEIELDWRNDSFSLVSRGLLHSYQSGSRIIRTARSVLVALATAVGPVYLNQGIDIVSDELVLATSDKLSSILTVPFSSSVPIDSSFWDHPQYLNFVAAHLQVKSMTHLIIPGNCVVIYAPKYTAAVQEKIWSYCLRDQGMSVSYLTGSKELAASDTWIYCNPLASRRVFVSHLPKTAFTFVNLSHKNDSCRVLDYLPPRCQYLEAPMKIGKDSSKLVEKVSKEITEVLASSQMAFKQYVADNVAVKNIEYSIGEILDHKPSDISGIPILNWSCPEKLPINCQPVDASRQILHSDATYWLVGLTGDLGLSLSDWMISHGARNIILTSRNPKVPSDWIKTHRAGGANIVSLAGDITNIASLKDVYATITDCHPPLDGIVSGAMIMRENLFHQTTIDEFQQVVKPKVEGLLNLEELLGDRPLLFFIAFSSVLATLGNMGQSAYTAANVASEALITRRQKRGLAGSVIQISHMTDVGYVKRQRSTYSTQEMERLDAYCMPMGERHLHALFAEGILAGRPQQHSVPIITAGVPKISVHDDRNAAWMKNVRFSHFWKQEALHQDGRVEDREGNIPIQTQLSQASSPSEVQEIIRDGVLSKIRSSLHLPADQVVAEHMAVVDLGVDSLIAVDIRTWIITELGVDIPVLKLLAGITTSEIVQSVMETNGAK